MKNPATNPSLALSGAHLRTYETIFQHPVSHNLHWHDVRNLLDHLGDMKMEPNGNLKVVRNGEALVLHPPRKKDVADTRELMEIRHFLERSNEAQPAAEPGASHWLVVIDHQQALIYRTEVRDDVPQSIRPHEDAEIHFRSAHEARDFMTGKEKAASSSFFAPVAEALKEADQILLFGTGTGRSCEMDQFAEWLKKHQPDTARRIVGQVVVDEQHLTEPQLLAQAREFYARPQLAER